MGYPTPQEVKVGTDALRSEAGIWDQQSDQMEAARAKIDSLELGLVEAGVFIVMVPAYNDVVRELRSRTDEAATTMIEIGSTLRTVADTYDSTDEYAARKHDNIF